MFHVEHFLENKTRYDMFNELFHYDLEESAMQQLVCDSLVNADDGELFLEFSMSESFDYNDNKLKNASSNELSGFGLRKICGESFGYAHSSLINRASLIKATNAISIINKPSNINLNTNTLITRPSLYTDVNPLGEFAFKDKVNLLESINQYIRTKCAIAKQVSISLGGSWQAV